MEPDTVLMTAILPVVYIIVDLVRPIPGIRDWTLPIIAAVTGLILGVLWAFAGGDTTNQDLMFHGIVGFSFGAGATGLNQIKQQAEHVQEGAPDSAQHDDV